MTQEQHIATQEWLIYFSDSGSAKERWDIQNKVSQHISVCPQCREFLDRALDLRRAAADLAESRTRMDDHHSAYSAVASDGSLPSSGARTGGITIGLDIRANEAFFLEDTLEAWGIGNKYGLNAEKQGRCLADDGGAFTAELTGKEIHVAFKDGNTQAQAALITDEASAPIALFQGTGAAPLPDENYCVLEIVLTE